MQATSSARDLCCTASCFYFGVVIVVLGTDTIWVAARIELILRAYFEANNGFVFASHEWNLIIKLVGGGGGLLLLFFCKFANVTRT